MYFALFKWDWHVGGVEAIFLLQKYINIKPCQPFFFGRGLLAESVNKDSMVKLTLSQTNLLISFVEQVCRIWKQQDTHHTPTFCCNDLIHRPFSTLHECLGRLQEANMGGEPRLQL